LADHVRARGPGRHHQLERGLRPAVDAHRHLEQVAVGARHAEGVGDAAVAHEWSPSPPASGTTAVASISTSRSGPTSDATWTRVEAGRTSRKTSPWARPTSSQREMSVTNMRVRMTFSNPPPARRSACPIFSRAYRV